MTMITAVAPSGDCPLWHAFLNTVTGNDADLKKFLQVASGYSLTGSTREQILLFLYGKGKTARPFLSRPSPARSVIITRQRRWRCSST